MDEMRATQQWRNARAAHFVALYAACHEQVYGFAPAELDAGKEYAQAQLAASRLIAQFGNDREEVLAFMHWTWRREESREKWRREQGTGGQRLGWRLQFHASLVSDYRVDVVRRKTR